MDVYGLKMLNNSENKRTEWANILNKYVLSIRL